MTIDTKHMEGFFAGVMTTLIVVGLLMWTFSLAEWKVRGEAEAAEYWKRTTNESR